MRKQIEKILKENIMPNDAKCPYCDFKGVKTNQAQLTHHLINRHRKEYDEKYSKVAKILALFPDQQKLIEHIKGMLKHHCHNCGLLEEEEVKIICYNQAISDILSYLERGDYGK